MLETQASPTIGLLAAALAKAQGKIQAAAKDRTADIKSDKAKFTYSYATLASVWEACREPLSANELAVTQLASTDGNKVTVVTILMHASGEYISSALTLLSIGTGPQQIGSALTYAKRYGLCAMVGVAPDDESEDDGAGPMVGDLHSDPEARASGYGYGAAPRVLNRAPEWVSRLKEVKSLDALEALEEQMVAADPPLNDAERKALAPVLSARKRALEPQVGG